MRKVKYIGYTDVDLFKHEGRYYSPAASSKLMYIANTIANLGYHLNIISPAVTINKKGSFSSRKTKIAPNISLKLYPTFGAKLKLMKIIRKYIPLILLFLDLLFKTKKNDTIIVYHSLNYMLLIYLAKKIKKFNLILEVEEIYQDIVNCTNFSKRMEYRIFYCADKYIFPTQLLNDKINQHKKPYTIIHGTYQVEKNINLKFNDGKIHVVYAGTFDQKKGGAIAAIDAAQYLSNNYHLHILGFGSKKEVETIEERIKMISQMAKSKITYNGLLKGEEYNHFLDKCDIGLSTQTPEAVYNETSFPSKILSYMANGLRVVSIRIKVVEISAVGHEVFYYEENTPKSIAKAIRSIEIDEQYNSKEIIRKLDEDFTKNIKKLLEG